MKLNEAQRLSWVRGELKIGSDADEAAYSRALREKDQKTIDRLNRESQERVDAYLRSKQS